MGGIMPAGFTLAGYRCAAAGVVPRICSRHLDEDPPLTFVDIDDGTTLKQQGAGATGTSLTASSVELGGRATMPPK